MSPKYASSGQVIELNNTSLRRRVTYSKEAFEALLYVFKFGYCTTEYIHIYMIYNLKISSFPLEILTKHI